VNPRRYHIVGVGGVGMSALAEVLMDSGVAVSGSDRAWDQSPLHAPLLVFQKLAAQGARLCPQDGSGIEAGTEAVVVSSAIEKDNPDIQRATALGIPVRHRAEVLAEAVSGRTVIAVAGTSGKSTTTAMLGAILAEGGADPMVVNGAAVVEWSTETRVGSVRRGRGAWCVVEVDESDKSLLRFTPAHAIITNASADHFPLEETLTLFEAFKRKVTGVVIDGTRDGHRIESTQVDAMAFDFILPSSFNRQNACQAAQMALALGVSEETIARALKNFKGVERRLERVGTRRDGVIIFDDYAHNTEKLRAVWQTLGAHSRRLLGVWRPHGYGPLRAMTAELATMFATTCRSEDILYLLPVYDAGGTADRTVSSAQLADLLREKKVNVVEVHSHEDAITNVNAEAREGDIIATLGARDPELPVTARKLAGLC